MASNQIVIDIPPVFEDLFLPKRYKIYYGGRGGAKTESFGRVLIARAYTQKITVLCARMYQNSILESVHQTLVDIIYTWNLQSWFDIQKTAIICTLTGSRFIFKGLQNNIQEIKSMKGITVLWVEEAISVTDEMWLYLDPTIRENKSEVWLSFNPEKEDAPTQVRFVQNKERLTDLEGNPDYICKKVGWRDNIFWPETLEKQRRNMLRDDPENYDWVWEGEFKQLTEAQVFHNKLLIKEFDEPTDDEKKGRRYYFGLDFGYSQDPTCLIRCFVKPSIEGHGEDLIIDREAYAHHLELDEMAEFFDKSIEEVRDWHIKADNARPECISYLSRQGFQISAAEKWKGSVEDGITHLRAFRKIIIHETRCPNSASDFRRYSWKVDEQSRDANGKPQVLPVLVDKWNHACDSARYALDDLIHARGGLGVWARM